MHASEMHLQPFSSLLTLKFHLPCNLNTKLFIQQREFTMHASELNLQPVALASQIQLLKMPSQCANETCTFNSKGSFRANGSTDFSKCQMCRVHAKSALTDFTSHELGGLTSTCVMLSSSPERKEDLEKAMQILEHVPQLRSTIEARMEAKKQKDETTKKRKTEAGAEKDKKEKVGGKKKKEWANRWEEAAWD